MTFGRNIQNTLEQSLAVCMLQFAFYQLYQLSNRTPKITQILKITHHTPCQHGAFGKEDKILIKNVHECKGYKYNALYSLEQNFRIKVGRRTASTGCW